MVQSPLGHLPLWRLLGLLEVRLLLGGSWPFFLRKDRGFDPSGSRQLPIKESDRDQYHLALFIDNNDNDMTFFGNIVFLRPCSVICGPTRAQINNIPEKSHVIPLLKNSYTL